MTDSAPKTERKQKELTGVFLDHRTGRSHTYVARFRTAASDLLWSARVKLGDRWVPIRGGRVIDGGAEQDDFVMSELVRDSVVDSLYDSEMDQALASAALRRRRALVVWRLVMAVLVVVVIGGAFFWRAVV